MALYTIQSGPNRGGTIDTDTVPEGVIDQLIQQEGGQPPLLARKSFLEQARVGQQTQADQMKAEIEKTTNDDLQKRMDAIFGAVETAGTQKIDEQAAAQRRRAVAEEMALGRGTSRAAFAPGSRISQVDTGRNNAMTQLFGNIATQKASGQLDVAKTIRDILSREKMFGQEIDFNRDKLLAGINENAENRGLERYSLDAKQRQQRDLLAEDDFTKFFRKFNTGYDTTKKVGKDVFNIATLASGKPPASF